MTHKHTIIIAAITIIISTIIAYYMRPGSSTIRGSLSDAQLGSNNTTIIGTLAEAPNEINYFFADFLLMSETDHAKNLLADIFKLNNFYSIPKYSQLAVITAITPNFGKITIYDRPKAFELLKAKFAPEKTK